MIAIVFGISFAVLATLHWYGVAMILPLKEQQLEDRKDYQKGYVKPYTISSIGFLIWGIIHSAMNTEDSVAFVVGLVVIAVVPWVMIQKHRAKYGLK